MPEPDPPTPARRWRAPGLLFAVVVATYATAMQNGFVYDDFEVLLAQAPVKNAVDAVRIFSEPHGLPLSGLPYYRPIPRLALLAQKGIHGEIPALFHAGNAVLMGLVALAAFAVLRAPRFRLAPAAAALGAAAFALHPIGSSVVHPISSGRESCVPALFILLTVAAWLRGGIRGQAVAWIALVLALFSKEQAIVVPALFLWADALQLPPDAPGRNLTAWFRRHAPVLGIVLAYLTIRGAVVPSDRSESDAGLAGLFALVGETLAANPLGPIQTLAFAVQSAFAPYLGLFYEPAFAVWFSPLRLAIACGVLMWVIVAVLRGPEGDRAPALFWLGWIPICAALTLNILPQEAPFAERYVFLSSLGFVAWTTTALARAADRPGQERMALGIALVAIPGLATVTIHRGVYYRDGLAFARQWAATSPAHFNARYTHGTALATAGHPDDAIAEIREALRLEPALAAGHYNLGVLLAERGRANEAIRSFRTALRLHPEDASARYALGILLRRSGREAEARIELREALRLAPDWPEPRRALEAGP